jgi:hypothetical protein
VKRKTLFAALACALLVFSMLGCGTTDHLQSIQLSTSNTLASAGSTLTLYGIGGTVQLYTWGNYSNGKQTLLQGNQIAYQISSTATGFAETGGPLGDPNADPPGTVQLLTPNGLLTAIAPFACTWENVATTGTTPAFVITGYYTVTATYQGMTSPPAFVTVASAAGIESATNPEGLCTNPPSGS